MAEIGAHTHLISVKILQTHPFYIIYPNNIPIAHAHMNSHCHNLVTFAGASFVLLSSTAELGSFFCAFLCMAISTHICFSARRWLLTQTTRALSNASSSMSASRKNLVSRCTGLFAMAAVPARTFVCRIKMQYLDLIQRLVRIVNDTLGIFFLLMAILVEVFGGQSSKPVVS